MVGKNDRINKKMARIISIIKYGMVLLSITLNLSFLVKEKNKKFQQNTSKRSIVYCQERELVISSIQNYMRELMDVRVSLSTELILSRIVDQHFSNVQKILNNLQIKKHPIIEQGLQRLEMTNKPRHSKVKNETQNNTSFPCVETYLGTLHGYPSYNKGFHRSKCQDISQRMTLVMDQPIIESVEKFQRTLSFVKERFKNIHVLLKPSDCLSVNRISKEWRSKLSIHLIKRNDNVSLHLNEIVQNIDSEYLVIASKVVLMNEQFDVIRMVQVYHHLKLGIVASSIKNYQTGKWETGCYQTTLQPYKLTYSSGYRKSRRSCLKCDFVGGAFLVSSHLLKNYPFREGLVGALYEDLFLRLQVLL